MTNELVAELRKLHADIVECDEGRESPMMALVRRAADELSKPAHEREPPNCPTCECGAVERAGFPLPHEPLAPQFDAAAIHRVCHSLSGTCEMILHPENACTPENCVTMRTALNR